jgi:hypothetical protein
LVGPGILSLHPDNVRHYRQSCESAGGGPLQREDTHMPNTAAGKLSADALLKHSEISRDALRHLITAAEAGGWKLVDWERFGTPVIDRVVAGLEGPSKAAGAMVDNLIGLPGARTRIRDIFPKGIPVIDQVRIEVELSAGH